MLSQQSELRLDSRQRNDLFNPPKEIPDSKRIDEISDWISFSEHKASPLMTTTDRGVQAIWIVSAPFARRTLKTRRVLEIFLALTHGPEGNSFTQLQIFCNRIDYASVAQAR